MSNTAIDLSIVIPTRNEAANVEPLVKRIAKSLNDSTYEVIFVDDSDDDTPQRIEELAALGNPLRVIHRDGAERAGGLSTAVVQGFRAARGRYIASLDADLQHPPEKLPQLIAALDDADIAIASRYIPGGSIGGLAGPIRKLGSWGCKKLGQLLVKRARLSTDPLGGFFALRREIIEGVDLQPIGFKILLEILAKGHVHRVAEIPYVFDRRSGGTSKADVRQLKLYLQHLAQLRFGEGAAFMLSNVIVLIGWLLGGALAYLYHMLSGRILGPADYSIVAASLAAIAVITSPAMIVTTIAARFSATADSHATLRRLLVGLLRNVGIVGVVLVVIMCILSKWLADFFQMPVSAILVLAPAALINLLLLVTRGILQGRKQFTRMSFVYAFEPLLRTVSGAALALTLGAVAAVAGIPIGMLFAFLLAMWFLKPVFEAKDDSAQSFDGLWRYFLASILTFFGFMVIQQTDTLLAKHFFDPAQAGYYSAAATVGKIVFFATGSVATVMFPTVAQKHAKGLDTRRILRQCLLVVAGASLVIIVPFALFPAFTLNLLYGSQYANAVPLLPIYTVAATAISLISVLVNFFMATDMRRHIPFLWAAMIVEIAVLMLGRPSPADMVLVVTGVLVALLVALLVLAFATPLPLKKRTESTTH